MTYKASSAQVKKLADWVNGLKDAEREFFFIHLPILIKDWYDGEFVGPQKTEHLVVARRYFSIDALAVALAHLKPIFPVTLPTSLQRVTHIPVEPPKGYNILVSSKSQKKPLLSFTSLEYPVVAARQDDGRVPSIILQWKPKQELVLASTQTIAQLINAALMVNSLLPPALRKRYSKETEGWLRAQKTVWGFLPEREFLVYLPGNKSILCSWTPDPRSKYYQKKELSTRQLWNPSDSSYRRVMKVFKGAVPKKETTKMSSTSVARDYQWNRKVDNVVMSLAVTELLDKSTNSVNYIVQLNLVNSHRNILDLYCKGKYIEPCLTDISNRAYQLIDKIDSKRATKFKPQELPAVRECLDLVARYF